MIRRMLGRLRRLRWWHWLCIFVVIATTVRVSLPPILRRIMVAQASQVLKARVDIGDVDLALLTGGIALKDVAVREATRHGEPETAAALTEQGAVPAPPTSGLDGTHAEATTPPSVGGARSDTLLTPPLVAWKRFAVDLD